MVHKFDLQQFVTRQFNLLSMNQIKLDRNAGIQIELSQNIYLNHIV